MTDKELRERAEKLVLNYSAPIDIETGVLAGAIFSALLAVRDQAKPKTYKKTAPRPPCICDHPWAKHWRSSSETFECGEKDCKCSKYIRVSDNAVKPKR